MPAQKMQNITLFGLGQAFQRIVQIVTPPSSPPRELPLNMHDLGQGAKPGIFPLREVVVKKEGEAFRITKH